MIPGAQRGASCSIVRDPKLPFEPANIGTPSLHKQDDTWFLLYHGYDSDDVPPFVLGWSAPAAYDEAFGLPPNPNGDLDGDGDLDFDDISGFSGLLTLSPRRVPESSTHGLALIAGMFLVAVRRPRLVRFRHGHGGECRARGYGIGE